MTTRIPDRPDRTTTDSWLHPTTGKRPESSNNAESGPNQLRNFGLVALEAELDLGRVGRRPFGRSRRRSPARGLVAARLVRRSPAHGLVAARLVRGRPARGLVAALGAALAVV